MDQGAAQGRREEKCGDDFEGVKREKRQNRDKERRGERGAGRKAKPKDAEGITDKGPKHEKYKEEPWFSVVFGDADNGGAGEIPKKKTACRGEQDTDAAQKTGEHGCPDKTDGKVKERGEGAAPRAECGGTKIDPECGKCDRDDPDGDAPRREHAQRRGGKCYRSQCENRRTFVCGLHENTIFLQKGVIGRVYNCAFHKGMGQNCSLFCFFVFAYNLL